MTDTPLNFAFSKTSETPLHAGLSTLDLERLAQDYLLDCDYRLQSPRTIETRRIFIQNLLWFLKKRDFVRCGTAELRQFFSYFMENRRPNWCDVLRHFAATFRQSRCRAWRFCDVVDIPSCCDEDAFPTKQLN